MPSCQYFRPPLILAVLTILLLQPFTGSSQHDQPLLEEERLIEAIRDKDLNGAMALLDNAKPNSSNIAQLARWNYYKGTLAFEKYNFIESLECLEKAKGLTAVQENLQLAQIHFQMGRVYKDGFFNGEMARQYYSKAMQYYTKIGGHGEELAKVNFQMARSFPSNELEKRALYNQRALDFFERSPNQYKQEIAECLNLEALRIVSREGLTQPAIQLFLKAIALASETGVRQSRFLGKYYDNLGYLLCTEKKDMKAGIQMLMKGLHHNMRFRNNEYWIASSYTNLGSVYLESGMYDSAKIMLKEALKMKLKLYPKDHPEISFSYEHMASAFPYPHSYDSALHYYNLALGISTAHPQIQLSESILINPYILSFAYTVQRRSALLQQKYIQTKDVSLLLDAYQSMSLVDSTLKKTYTSFEWETSKISYLNSLDIFYNSYLDICFQLYDITQNAQYAYSGLQCMEARRYHSLLDNQNKIQSLYRVPNSEQLVQRELELKGLLIHQYYQLSIAEQTSSSHRAKEIQATINDLIQHYSNFQDSFKVRVKDPIINVPLDKNIHTRFLPHQVILEYQEMRDAYYVIVLTKDIIHFKRIEKTRTLQDALSSVMQAVRTTPSLHTFAEDKDKFVHHSHVLYEQLLAPFEDLVATTTSLYIIPDGLLYELPFYILLPKKENNGHFNTLHYLGTNVSISKALSLHLLLHPREHTPSLKDGVLAFGSSDKRLGLKDVVQELAAIESYFPVKRNTDSLCSTAVFFQEAADYPILHLALHGKQDSTNYYKSQLLFNEGDTLFAYSLYGMRLHNPLVLLSACESGLGKNHGGEGIFSMARAFSMAGASSLYVNMWEVSDKSAAELSSFFYEGFSKEKNPAEALHYANIQFLKNRDDYSSHPYFWASTQIVNNTLLPIIPAPGITLWSTNLFRWIVLSLILVSVCSITYYLKYATRTKLPVG